MLAYQKIHNELFVTHSFTTHFLHFLHLARVWRLDLFLISAGENENRMSTILFLSVPSIYSTLLTKYLSVFPPTHYFVTFITAWEER